jgi:hypothetical protein
MNRRGFITVSLGAAVALILPGPTRARPVFSWQTRRFDRGADVGTAITLILPDGRVIRNAARTKDCPRSQEVNAIHSHKQVLAYWVEHKFGIPKELIYAEA